MRDKDFDQTVSRRWCPPFLVFVREKRKEESLFFYATLNKKNVSSSFKEHTKKEHAKTHATTNFSFVASPNPPSSFTPKTRRRRRSCGGSGSNTTTNNIIKRDDE